jgi:hypothetical protein
VCKMGAGGDLTYRCHDTDILTVAASGDVKLTTGGWSTFTTLLCLNDALKPIGITVVNRSGRWVVTCDGVERSFSDDMVLAATRPADQHRARRVLQHARELGVPCHTRSPAAPVAPAPVAPTPAASAPVAPTPAAAAPPQPPKPPAWTRARQTTTTCVAASPVSESAVSAVSAGSAVVDAEYAECECIVCMERERDTVLIPCGHVALCHACTAGMTTCPVCMGPIADVIHLEL